MCQIRFDQSQPGGGKEIGVRIETTDGNTPLEQVYKTAQNVARRLEEKGYPINPEQEDEDTGCSIESEEGREEEEETEEL